MTATKTQNKTQHTPGSWKIEQTNRDEGYAMYYLANTQGAEFGAEAEANARLIAAAPEMLETLKRIAMTPNSDSYGALVIQWAKEAIARATE